MLASRLAPAAGLALALTVAAPARADLSDDAERLARAWAERGVVERAPPIFLEQGRVRAFRRAALRDGDPRCLTVAFLAARSVSFSLQREAASPPPEGEEPKAEEWLPSTAGALVLTACDAERRRIDRLRVKMGSPRATLEIVSARSDAPPRDLREILPERASGPLPPRGDPGGPIEVRPLAERLARASQRARSEGAAEQIRAHGRAQANGAGRFDLELAPGCHRLEIMADRPSAPPLRATDIDAEARDAAGRVLARDGGELPDARLELCVGEIGPVTVIFAGAPPGSAITLARARWSMPARVPSRWGPRARAGFASALRKRRAPDPLDPPIFEALGVQGNTAIPLEIEPGRCYLASIAMIRGDARMIRFSVSLGDRTAREDVSGRPESASAALCAEHEGAARFEVDVRAGTASWALAVWPMGAAAP